MDEQWTMDESWIHMNTVADEPQGIPCIAPLQSLHSKGAHFITSTESPNFFISKLCTNYWVPLLSMSNWLHSQPGFLCVRMVPVPVGNLGKLPDPATRPCSSCRHLSVTCCGNGLWPTGDCSSKLKSKPKLTIWIVYTTLYNPFLVVLRMV